MTSRFATTALMLLFTVIMALPVYPVFAQRVGDDGQMLVGDDAQLRPAIEGGKALPPAVRTLPSAPAKSFNLELGPPGAIIMSDKSTPKLSPDPTDPPTGPTPPPSGPPTPSTSRSPGSETGIVIDNLPAPGSESAIDKALLGGALGLGAGQATLPTAGPGAFKRSDLGAGLSGMPLPTTSSDVESTTFPNPVLPRGASSFPVPSPTAMRRRPGPSLPRVGVLPNPRPPVGQRVK